MAISHQKDKAIHQQIRATLVTALAIRIRMGSPVLFRQERVGRDGTTFPASCTVVGLRDAAGRITHFVGVERDITEELKLRDQLVHSERLSAIGELVAGVAHEINNPLQTIVGSVELMMEERSGAPSRHDLEVEDPEVAAGDVDGHVVDGRLADPALEAEKDFLQVHRILARGSRWVL